MLNEQELEYSRQKNREHMYSQAIRERKEMNASLGDFSWEGSDELAVEYRYMQLCERANIKPY